MPTASAVLKFSRGDRDMLGGWAAEGSERYSRAAKFKNASMQQSVSSTFKSADHDPLAEADDTDSLDCFRSPGMYRTKRYCVRRPSWSVVHSQTFRRKSPRR